jgi:hypothetical protein
VLFEHRDVRLLANQAGQCVLHRLAGSVGDMDDAPGAVTALAGQMVAAFVTRKRHALFNQPVDSAPTVFDHEASGARVIQESTRGDRVANVGFDRIAVVEHRGNAALRPARGAIFEGALADQCHLACFGQPQGCGLSSQATANDENVEAKRHGGASCQQGRTTIAREEATTSPAACVDSWIPASHNAGSCRFFSQAENSRPSSGCVSPSTTLACIRPSLLPQS